MDISSTAIDKARDRHPDCEFDTFDRLSMRYADASFDLVFSYHVLEHVDDVELSARDIARVLAPGGWAVIIFPCGNPGSLLDRLMQRMQGARVPGAGGRMRYFFESADGHVRRMSSQDTIELFAACGLQLQAQWFSGHFFGTIDWLARGTGVDYLNRMFRGQPATGRWAAIWSASWRRGLLALHRLLRLRNLDLTRNRPAPKQLAVRAAVVVGNGLARLLATACAVEWRWLRAHPAGTAQYLVFAKPFPRSPAG